MARKKKQKKFSENIGFELYVIDGANTIYIDENQ